MSPIELHIDELVLEGVTPGDGHRVAEALAHELARLTAEGSPLAAGTRSRTVDRLDAGTLPSGPPAAPGALGAQIALAVHQSLGGRHDR